MGKPREDQYANLHSNGLVVIGVADTHPLLAAGGVRAVSFATGKNKRDLAEVKPRGKKKRGTLFVQAETAICEVTCENGATYILRGVARGNLIEVNTRLLKDPSLLATKPGTEGYLAVLGPRKGDWPTSAAILKTHDDYKAICKARE